ncbi:MAG TPA: hypothetical protein VF432_04380 [Thermoanaerobaculia bacterium]
MIAALLAVLQSLVVGIAAARWIDPAAPPRRLLGTAYLLGSGICAFVLLALSVAGIRWTTATFTVAYCLVAIALWAPLLRRAAPAVEGGGRASLIDLGTLALVIAHGVYAWKAGGREWDFWAIWGQKARVFFTHGGVDWTFLVHPDHAFTHPDYPPLLSLEYVRLALLGGAWNESPMGLLSTLHAAAVLLIVRDFFAEELRPAMAAAATLAAASGALSNAGMADAPMIAYGTAALLSIRRGSMRTGAVLLGLAAFTKNEGLALIAAVVLGLVADGRRAARRSAILRLWPALAIVSPWLVLRAVHALPTDLATGALSERIRLAFSHVPELLRALAEFPPRHPLFWIGVAAALLVYARQLDRERFLLTVIVVQLGFYLAAYLVTPHDLTPHVGSSWPRILQHVAIPAAFVALTLTLRRFDESRAA